MKQVKVVVKLLCKLLHRLLMLILFLRHESPLLLASMKERAAGEIRLRRRMVQHDGARVKHVPEKNEVFSYRRV